MDTPEPRMTVVLMGATGSGKSTFINIASGSNLAVSNSLESCTAEVETSTPFCLDGHTVTLIDTPGFDDTTRSDTDILRSITDYLCTSYKNGTKLSGLIYMYRITDNKMGGPSRRNVHLFRHLCGENSLRNVLIVTNMWSMVDPEVGDARERELESNEKFFKPVLKQGARMRRHDGSQRSALNLLRQLIDRSAATLLIQQELVDERKHLVDTTAGAELMRELNEQAGRHSQALEELCREIEAAKAAKDEETKKELQEEAAKTREKIERIRGDLERMVTHFATENDRLGSENRRYKKDLAAQRGEGECNARLLGQERKAREHAETRQRQAEAELAAERERREWERKQRERRIEALKREKEESDRREGELQERIRRVEESSSGSGCVLQ